MNGVTVEIQAVVGIEAWTLGTSTLDEDQDSYPQLAACLRAIADELDEECERSEVTS
jgi:hypothetical protein